MSITNQPAAFAWNDIALSEVVMINSVPHTTRRAIGEWLQYADPQKAIDNIISRNPHLETHSVPLNLRGTDGKNYDTFAYHPIGFLLIVMESGQPQAHAMKAAVAEFVWSFAGPRKLSFRESDSLMKRRMALLDRIGSTRDAFVQAALLAYLREVSLTAGMPVPDVGLLGTSTKHMVLQGV